MHVTTCPDPRQLGAKASALVAEKINAALGMRDFADIILATGASQFTMLEHLVARQDVDWSRVRMFHLDEYVGIEETHPASFRRYLKERFLAKVPALAEVNLINGTHAQAEVQRLNKLIATRTIAVACVGVGENGHLAFNDPPADFETTDPYLIVDLDEDCRRQQVGEGWFKTVADVPARAISMSVNCIMKCECVVLSAPDQRKARAVRGMVEGPVTQDLPASILQRHADCHLFLDAQSASLLTRR